MDIEKARKALIKTLTIFALAALALAVVAVLLWLPPVAFLGLIGLVLFASVFMTFYHDL